jgi:hypothetical protein
VTELEQLVAMLKRAGFVFSVFDEKGSPHRHTVVLSEDFDKDARGLVFTSNGLLVKHSESDPEGHCE